PIPRVRAAVEGLVHLQLTHRTHHGDALVSCRVDADLRVAALLARLRLGYRVTQENTVALTTEADFDGHLTDKVESGFCIVRGRGAGVPHQIQRIVRAGVRVVALLQIGFRLLDRGEAAADLAA